VCMCVCVSETPPQHSPVPLSLTHTNTHTHTHTHTHTLAHLKDYKSHGSCQRDHSKESAGSDVLFTAQHTGSLPLFKRGLPPIRGSQRSRSTTRRPHTH